MGNFESQKYRDDLAKEIRQEPDKEKRRVILETAKSTEEYQEAKRLGRQEERPFLGEFTGGEIDEVGEYAEPTPEQREKFQKRNERMAEIFEGADFQWYLDGAVNISLYGDRQIRDHKDLDMSVFREDAAKLEELLSRQDFGIFVNYEQNGKRLMRRATPQELSGVDRLDLSVCKIGAGGKIEIETRDPFNFVDLHVHGKDAQGNTVINYSGASLPKEFFDPIEKELSNGKEINLSQPAIVAYHKLHSNRPYDLTDLQKLRPYLQEKDFAMLRESLGKEIGETERKTEETLQEAWGFLSPMLESTHDQKIISEKLWEHADLKKRRNDQKISGYIAFISQYISEHQNITVDDFIYQSMAILKPREHIEQKLRFLDQLESSPSNGNSGV
jgi:hypothetical protein